MVLTLILSSADTTQKRNTVHDGGQGRPPHRPKDKLLVVVIDG